MNDRDEIAQLRLLDTFLENGETDRHAWRDEVGAALVKARMSCLSGMEPMPEHEGSSVAASGEDADILARLKFMKGEEEGWGMTLVERNRHARYWETPTDDNLEIASSIAERIK